MPQSDGSSDSSFEMVSDQPEGTPLFPIPTGATEIYPISGASIPLTPKPQPGGLHPWANYDKINTSEAASIGHDAAKQFPALPLWIATKHHDQIQQDVRHAQVLIDKLGEDLAKGRVVDQATLDDIKNKVSQLAPLQEQLSKQLDQEARELTAAIAAPDHAALSAARAGAVSAEQAKEMSRKTFQATQDLKTDLSNLKKAYDDQSAQLDNMVLGFRNGIVDMAGDIAEGDRQIDKLSEKIADLAVKTPLDIMAVATDMKEEYRTEMVGLKKQLDELTAKVTSATVSSQTEEHLKQVIRDAVHELLSSTATESILANAAARGIGGMLGTVIVGSIFGAITTPFKVGSDAANTVAATIKAVDDAADAVDKASSAIARFRDESKETFATFGSMLEQSKEERKKNAEEGKAAFAAVDENIQANQRLLQREAQLVHAKLDRAANTTATKQDLQTGLTLVRSDVGEDIKSGVRAGTAMTTKAILSKQAHSNGAMPNAEEMASKVDRAQTSFGKRKMKPGGNAPISCTKIGDHSVQAVDVMGAPCLKTPGIKAMIGPIPSWWRLSWQHMAEWQSRVSVDDDGDFYINSYLAPILQNGTPRAGVQVQGLAMETTVNAAVADALLDCEITFTTGTQVGVLDKSYLNDYMLGGRINDRSIMSILNGSMHPANPNLLRDTAYFMNVGLEVWDNSAIYAKLMHYALVKTHAERQGYAVTQAAYASDVSYVNLADNNTTRTDVTRIISKQQISFLAEGDWLAGDTNVLGLIYLLSSSGRRLTINGAVNAGIAARYISWPAIPITIYTQAVAPAAPAVVTFSANDVIEFAEMLAQQRGEEDHLIRGLYIAMDLCGIRYPAAATNQTARRWCSHLFGTPTYSLPKPGDYNFMARAMGIRPAQATAGWAEEWAAFKGSSITHKMRALALYVKVENVAATTVMAHYNMCKRDVACWITTGAAPVDEQLIHLLRMLNEPAVGSDGLGSDSEARFRVMCKMVSASWMGFTNIDRCYKATTWLGTRGLVSQVNMGTVWNNLSSDTVPLRLGSVLCIAAFLKAFPIEWGVVGAGSHFDISREVIAYGEVATRRWEAWRGDARYRNAPLSRQPYEFIEYGAAILNCVCTRLYNAADPNAMIQWQSTDFMPGSDIAIYSAPAANANIRGDYNTDLRCYEPCSIRSWDWHANLLWAPTLIGGLTSSWWRYVGPGGLDPSAGLYVYNKDETAAIHRPAQPMDFSGGVLGELMGLQVTTPDAKAPEGLKQTAGLDAAQQAAENA